MESGGAEYKLSKQQLEEVTKKVSELEKLITRMRSTLSNTEVNLLRYDKEIEKEGKEIKKLEEVIAKLKLDIEMNTKSGEDILAKMAAIDAERKENKLKLDNRRNEFGVLKKDMQRIEEEEAKAKQLVEEAIKQRNVMDEYCKKVKNNIRENRDKYK